MKECLRSRIDELASESKDKQAKKEKSFYVGCYLKVWPRFRVSSLTSNDPDLGQVFHRQMIWA